MAKSNRLIFAVIPIVAIGLGYSIYRETQKETVPLGGECSERADCVDRNECLLGPDGTGICSTVCNTAGGQDSCPDGLQCASINLSIDTPGNEVNLDGAMYCMPARGAPKP